MINLQVSTSQDLCAFGQNTIINHYFFYLEEVSVSACLCACVLSYV